MDTTYRVNAADLPWLRLCDEPPEKRTGPVVFLSELRPAASIRCSDETLPGVRRTQSMTGSAASQSVGKRIRLLPRKGRDMAPQFPEIVSELRLIPHHFAIDGELVVVDEHGHTDWTRVRNRAVARKTETIIRASAADPAAMFAFDLLWRDGEDYRHFPLTIRKAQLRAR
jgi:hypothetical protein